MSEIDIIPGSGWLSEISNKLRNSEVGVVCLTPENINKPWINFESGALTRELNGKSNLVIPYLFDFRRKEALGPLSFFQAIELSSLIRSIRFRAT